MWNGEAYNPEMGRLISKIHFDRLLPQITNSGGKILFGGNSDAEKLWIQPTIIENPDLNSRLMQEEIFGPIFPVFKYN